jgi:riboflavin-specific deaminase-like protein
MDQAAGAVIKAEDHPISPENLAPVSLDDAWQLLLTLRREADRCAAGRNDGSWGFRQAGGHWVRMPGRQAQIWLDSRTGEIRQARRQVTSAARLLFELNGPHAACNRAAGHVIAMLGQSLDGFIATCSGHSRYINGQESLVHQHRLRALSDAVVIGVGTAVADGPRLTTRNVAGPNAVRVVLDPRGRLPADSGLLCDGAATTLVVRATDRAAFERRLSEQGTALHLPGKDGRVAPGAVLKALADRGLRRVLVEGGGITVGRFLEAGQLDRLQLAVAPLILGAGRPALPVAPAQRLEQALRPVCGRHLLGEDVLFDLRFSRSGDRD